MSSLARTDVEIAYETAGDGPLVVLVMGAGSRGTAWKLHQVPALVAAGYRAVVFDHRGIGASQPPDGDTAVLAGTTIDDLVADTAALIERLGAPAHVVGTSLGARVAAELALARPELVDRAVLMAAHARLDPVQQALSRGELAMADTGAALPPSYLAAVTALMNLSPATLADERTARDWLELLELYGGPAGPGERAQLALADFADRREAYRGITRPCLAIGFADDRMIPPWLAREVAEAVPGGRYTEIGDCGHFGYLERPGAVNRAIVDFLTGRET